MLVLFPDANALNKNPHFKGKLAEGLLGELDLGDAQLQLSPVVMGELRRQETDDIDDVLKSVEAAVRRKSRGSSAKMPGVVNRIGVELEAVKREIDDQFSETAARPNVYVQDWPTTSSQELGERELSRRKPFLEVESGGKKVAVGHRDALIWEGVRESARRGGPDQVIVLVSDDKGFWNEGKSALDEELLIDLDSDGTARDRVVIVQNLEQARVKMQELRSEITPEHAEVARELITLTTNYEGQEVGWTFDPREGDVVETGLELGLPRELEDARIVAVDLVDEVIIAPGTKYVAKQIAEFAISGTMYVSDWYSLEGVPGLELWGSINDQYVEIYAVRRVEIEATVRISPSGTAEATEVRVRAVEENVS